MSMMRLSTLVPTEVAEQAHDAVVSHVQRLAFVAGLDVQPGAGLSDVHHSVHQLTVYAQTGGHPEGRPELIGEYLQSVAEPLYTRAGDGAGYDVPDLGDDADPQTPWGLVLLAAATRHLIEQRSAVTLAGLAVLAEVTAGRLRQLVVAGEIQTDGAKPARVTAAFARSWLEARGVAGFAGVVTRT